MAKNKQACTNKNKRKTKISYSPLQHRDINNQDNKPARTVRSNNSYSTIHNVQIPHSVLYNIYHHNKILILIVPPPLSRHSKMYVMGYMAVCHSLPHPLTRHQSILWKFDHVLLMLWGNVHSIGLWRNDSRPWMVEVLVDCILWNFLVCIYCMLLLMCRLFFVCIQLRRHDVFMQELGEVKHLRAINIETYVYN